MALESVGFEIVVASSNPDLDEFLLRGVEAFTVFFGEISQGKYCALASLQGDRGLEPEWRLHFLTFNRSLIFLQDNC